MLCRIADQFFRHELIFVSHPFPESENQRPAPVKGWGTGIGSSTQTPCTRQLHRLLYSCSKRKIIVGERGSMTRIFSPPASWEKCFLLAFPFIEPAMAESEWEPIRHGERSRSFTENVPSVPLRFVCPLAFVPAPLWLPGLFLL